MRRVVLVGLLAAAGGLAGCSPSQYFAQPASVEETRDSVRAMKEEQAAMARRVESLEAELRGQAERTAERDAGLKAELATMAESLQRISERLEDLGQQVQRRSRQAPAPALYPPPVLPDVEPAADSSGAIPPGGAGSTGFVQPPAGDAGELYDRAYRDVTRGNYALAVDGFQEFLRSYPDDDLSDNAQYWLGECYYVQDQITEASREFEKVLTNHAGGDKVPAATLKLGYCALRQNDTATARRWFDELIRKYPNSDEARSARSKLAALE